MIVPKEMFKNKKAWLITSDYIGQRVISVSVAKALGIDYEEKLINPPWLQRSLAPWGGVAFSEKIGQSASLQFAKPWPDIAIGVGRQSVAYLKALKKASSNSIFTIMLQDPKSGTSAADLIWVPEHDSLRGDNVITTLLSPHKYTPDMLCNLRENPHKKIKNLPYPRIGLIIGGKSKAFPYDEDSIESLCQAIDSLKNFAGSFLVTCSRRTPPALEKALHDILADSPKFFWDGTGENPYGDFLAHSDYIIVTADSVNMVGEATASGKPVYVFFPEGGGRRIDYYHKRMQEEGFTRPLSDDFEGLESWRYQPQFAANIIAQRILEKWSRSS